MMTHPTDQLESYALGALEPDKAARVARHVHGCATCQQRLREIDRTLGLLATLAPEAAPPEGAEERLFARIAEHRQRAPFAVRKASPLAVSMSPLSSMTAWLQQSSDSRTRRALYAVATLAALLLITVGILLGQLNAARTANAALAAQRTQQQRTLNVLNSPGAVVRHLVATDKAAGGATGTMVMDPANKDGVFVVSQLPPLPPEKTYEFWLVQSSPGTAEGETIPTGTFTVDSTGQALVTFNTEVAAARLSNAGVSVETAGGATHPDSPMIMLIAG